MLTSVKDLLERALLGGYAVAAPNITNSVEAEAAIAAAEAMHAPLIFDVLPEDMGIRCPEAFVRWLRERADIARVPIAINVDDQETQKAGALPVDIGTKRGYADIGLLQTIRQSTPGSIPLILHGCAGVPAELLREACRTGVNKLDIASDLRRAMTKAILDSGGDGNPIALAATGYTTRLMEMIEICGSGGKA